MAYYVRFKDRSMVLPDYAVLFVEKEPGHGAAMEVRSLNPGVRATVTTEYVPAVADERPIERIEDALKSIPIYAAVRSAVFRRNSEGYESTVLRHALFSSLAGTMDADDLESRIFVADKDNDFTPGQYDKVAEKVNSILQGAVAAGELPSHAAVRLKEIRNKWLKGVTYFPKHWETLQVLAQQFPELKPYYESYRNFESERSSIASTEDYYDALDLDTPTPNLFGSYLFFRGVRSVESRISAKPKGEGSSPRNKRRGTLFHYRDITERMASYLKERISDEHSLEMVIEVRKLKGSGNVRTDGPDPNFARGVYIGTTPPKESRLALIEPQSIYNDHIILDYIFKKWAEKLVDHIAMKMWPQRDVSYISSLAAADLSKDVSYTSPEINRNTELAILRLEPALRKMYDELRHAVDESIDRALPDQLIGVRPGLYRRTMRKYEEVRRFIPHEMERVLFLTYKGPGGRATDKSRDAQRATRRELDKLRDKMVRKFGMDPMYSIIDVIYESAAYAIDLAIDQMSDVKDKVRFLAEREERIVEALRKVYVEKGAVLTYSQISSTLQRMGLEDLLEKFFDKALHDKTGLL